MTNGRVGAALSAPTLSATDVVPIADLTHA
jgi:hypothetical protein